METCVSFFKLSLMTIPMLHYVLHLGYLPLFELFCHQCIKIIQETICEPIYYFHFYIHIISNVFILFFITDFKSTAFSKAQLFADKLQATTSMFTTTSCQK